MISTKGSTFNTLDNFKYANIEDYGAIGDGVTNNYNAIIAALAASDAVFIPVGTFVSSPILVPDNKTIFGSGAPSILKLAAASSSALVSCGANTQLRLFKLDGNKLNQSLTNLHTVQSIGVTGVRLQSLFFSNINGNSIYIADNASQYIDILDCNIKGYTASGILITGGKNITVRGNRINTSDTIAFPGDGVSISAADSSTIISSIRLTGNAVNNITGKGIAVSGVGSRNIAHISLVGNSCIDTTQHGIYVTNAEQVVASSNEVLRSLQDGYRLEGNVRHTRFTNNIADACATFGMREIVSGVSPDFNGFLHNVLIGNANNTQTVVGPNSFQYAI